MGICKGCSTRLDEKDLKCPSCGRAVRYPGAGNSFSQTGAKAGLPSRAPAASEEEEAPGEAELELDSAVESPTVTPAPAPKTAAEPKVRRTAAQPPAGNSLFTIHPEELRARICENPELLEAGLRVYKEKGKEVGAGYSTEIGDIDLLAEDSHGALVVVMVPGAESPPDFLSDILQRVGWTSKHVAKPKQSVRGIVLLEPPVPELGYAASAVADTVSFKTWRVALTIDDVGA